VIIADDHALVRSGVRRILADGGVSVVGEATTGEEALAMARELRPDVVILDLVMPGAGGLETLPRLREAVPETAVLVLSMQDDVGYLHGAFDAGAAGYVTKDSADEELLAAVRMVAQGGQYVHPRLGAALLQARAGGRSASSPSMSGPGGSLSGRELEVLRELAMGQTNAQVAEKLYLSVRTVENHRAHIFQKLGVNTRVELVRRAIDAGLLDTGSHP